MNVEFGQTWSFASLVTGQEWVCFIVEATVDHVVVIVLTDSDGVFDGKRVKINLRTLDAYGSLLC